jgi:pyruvate formate lyase activating enzyme
MITKAGVRGRIFDLRRYSIHDGPGIRTTVFLKGCPLRCDWCQNPESQGRDPEAVLFPSRCIGCDACLPACPHGAISPETRRPDPRRCACCGTCVETCPAGARQILGRDLPVEELLAELERDRVFYDESGGGVTFSGGEPLAQPGFLRAALDLCRERGIHTALDTCGYAPREQAEDLARRADLLLYDLKAMDPERHRTSTGVPNGLILENLRAICGLGAAVWVRLPLIPGFNDDEGNLRATAEFVRALPGSPPLSLLPYHHSALAKYRRLGRRYPLEGTAAPSPDRVRQASDLLESLGLSVMREG